MFATAAAPTPVPPQPCVPPCDTPVPHAPEQSSHDPAAHGAAGSWGSPAGSGGSPTWGGAAWVTPARGLGQDPPRTPLPWGAAAAAWAQTLTGGRLTGDRLPPRPGIKPGGSRRPPCAPSAPRHGQHEAPPGGEYPPSGPAPLLLRRASGAGTPLQPPPHDPPVPWGTAPWTLPPPPWGLALREPPHSLA